MCPCDLRPLIGARPLVRDLVGGCLSEFPAAVGVAEQCLVGVVDEVVAVGAYQRHVFDVGFAFARCVPRDQVVGLALADVGTTADASSVSCDEATDLCRRGVAVLASVVDDFAVGVEHGRGDRAVAGVTSEHGFRDGATIGEFCGVDTGEEVVELNPHMDVPLDRTRA